ncbi:radical SAM protein [Candidatus Micrarchaeota archaeon]|nr:radical SAM protein [Candidatus Micrarchaeota archaeon]
MRPLSETTSICPECGKLLSASIYEEGGKVWISKDCAQHGKTVELYFGDYGMYEKFRRFDHVGRRVTNPNITKKAPVCPMDCGLCTIHSSHTALANVVLTNRCDLSCWYCFFYCKEGDKVYEPTLAQLKKMFRTLRDEKPIGCNALQLTGGEPALRDDLIEIIKLACEEGFEHVQLNTNGIRVSRSLEFAKAIRGAGVGTLYMSFDGVSAQTNPKNHWEVPAALDNCRKADVGVVLVPTVIKGVNDNELGDILRFGFKNIDIVRAVNFQPVSLVGRMPRQQREKMRITIPDAIKKIEEQTGGQVGREDFYPIPCVSSITRLVEAFTGNPQYDLSSHFACGAATYVFREGDEMIPITRFVDATALFEYLDDLARRINEGKNKTLAKAELLANLPRFVDNKKKPKSIDFSKLLRDALIGHNYKSLVGFHKKALFVGLMHFMDLYNYDAERVKRCTIHYAVPDGRVIPFCAFNVIPEKYRDEIQAKYAIPQREWEEKNGRKLAQDFYKRNPLAVRNCSCEKCGLK